MIRNRFVTAWFSAACLLGQAPETRADLLVSSVNTDQVLRYDDGGNYLGVFASGNGLREPYGLAIGPDGDLFVASHQSAAVLRYDGVTGRPEGVFASGGGLFSPFSLT